MTRQQSAKMYMLSSLNQIKLVTSSLVCFVILKIYNQLMSFYDKLINIKMHYLEEKKEIFI